MSFSLRILSLLLLMISGSLPLHANSAKDEILDTAFALGVLSAKHISNINRQGNLEAEREVPLPVPATGEDLAKLRQILTRVTQLEAQFRPGRIDKVSIGPSVGELMALGLSSVTATLFLWVRHQGFQFTESSAFLHWAGIADLALGGFSLYFIVNSLGSRFEGKVFGERIYIPGGFFETLLSPVRGVQSRMRRRAFVKQFREGFLSVAVPAKLLEEGKKYRGLGPRGLVTAAINPEDCVSLLAEVSSR